MTDRHIVENAPKILFSTTTITMACSVDNSIWANCGSNQVTFSHQYKTSLVTSSLIHFDWFQEMSKKGDIVDALLEVKEEQCFLSLLVLPHLTCMFSLCLACCNRSKIHLLHHSLWLRCCLLCFWSRFCSFNTACLKLPILMPPPQPICLSECYNQPIYSYITYFSIKYVK